MRTLCSLNASFSHLSNHREMLVFWRMISTHEEVNLSNKQRISKEISKFKILTETCSGVFLKLYENFITNNKSFLSLIQKSYQSATQTLATQKTKMVVMKILVFANASLDPIAIKRTTALKVKSLIKQDRILFPFWY